MTVPIIGGVKIGEDWFLTIPVTCPCGQHMLIAGQIGTERVCSCRRVHKLMRMPIEQPDGSINWVIGTAMPRIGEPTK